MGFLPLFIPLLKPLTVLIGPVPLFYLYHFWQTIPPSIQRRRRPLPIQSLVAIIILAFSSLLYFCIFSLGNSENIYYLTKARFITSPSILQTRLSKFRLLTADDQILLERLATSLSERLNYAKFGPNPLTHCAWCLMTRNEPTGSITLGDATMYLIFSLPYLAWPYLFHAFILGVTTTPFLTTVQFSRDMRVYLVYVLGLILAAEVWILVTFDGNVNSSAYELQDVIWLHWDLNSFRYSALAVVSGLHAMIIYVVETGWMVLPPSTNDRLFQIGTIGENVGQRTKLARAIRGVVMQNAEWRQTVERWWDKQRILERPEIPDDFRTRWAPEARKWVDGMIKLEEEQGQ